MEKSEIIKEFLKKGIQVDPRALDILVDKPEKVAEIMESDISKLPSIISKEFLDPKTKLDVNNLAKIVEYRYNFIKNILVDKKELTNLVSINKINPKLKQFSIIGIVNEINGDLELEDSTGRMKFSISKELAKQIVTDEVIGLVCERDDVKTIIYPDIPLKVNVKKSKDPKSCIIISGISDISDQIYTKFLKWLGSQRKMEILIEANPNIKKMESDISKLGHTVREFNQQSEILIDDIVIFIIDNTVIEKYSEIWKTAPINSALTLLRKRNFNPIMETNSFNNDYLVTTSPDLVIFTNSPEIESTNYKGTTILFNGSFNSNPIFWTIDLQTREAFKTNFL